MAIKAQIAGIILGLAGAMGLLYGNSLSFNYYGLFVVLATLLYGISTNEVSRVKEMNGLQITALAFFVLGPFALTGLLFSDFKSALETENWLGNLGYIALLAVIGSALALALFYLLVRDTSPVFASMVTYFIPVVATLWGIADGEAFTPMMLVSVAVIFAGVYLINRPDFARRIYSIFK
jgi:drug/metabolite transporter (DMT)-like permease